ncbi:P-aminobenzoate N-oxygenase AurF [Pseudomonas sp. 28 E 9]|uniref:diiron oxygenase n=1 Tax=Pseudomonas sp. 28 E 9 TaxID=1844098 RepID=UPI000812BF2B|nr:diiron oxygenase [Pseudomonas sp. 28 E 9]CRM21858.1 P-aminobenzoate N-oxygenase AurF [Pseudomonas sp. 28 E 9]
MSVTNTFVFASNEIRQYTLGDWDNRSAVRSKNSTFLLPADAEILLQLQTRKWFPPAFIPYFNDNTIQKSGEHIQHRLAANHLVYFLRYTTLLEHKIVNRSVETLIHEELGINLPQAMKLTALQLYTDEGYHALFSFKIAEQVAHFYDMPTWEDPPKRITLLLELMDATLDEHRPLAWFFFGFVSETIIAKELLSITGDTLISTVYQMFREHLEDEARHSRYFSEVFHYLWPKLSLVQQEHSASLLIKIIFIFAEVDEPWLSASLTSVGIPLFEATRIVQALQALDVRTQRARSIAMGTLQAMTRAGFFELQAHRELFSQSGLIDA